MQDFSLLNLDQRYRLPEVFCSSEVENRISGMVTEKDMGATPVGKLGILLFHESPEAVIALTKKDPSQVFFIYFFIFLKLFEHLFLGKFLGKSCARDRKNESRLPIASFLSTNKKKKFYCRS